MAFSTCSSMDLMGFAHHSVAARDQQTAQYILCQFFGPDAVAAKSILPCTQADLLGWAIDLSTETIRPFNRGCRKLLWAFFLVPQAAHQERPGIATGILPAALILSLPLLYSTARHVYVCSTFECTNCRHFRRPENHHIQCMVLH